MSFLKQVTVTPTEDEVQLEKPRVAVVYDGDTTGVSEKLAAIKAEHVKRTKTAENPNGEPFSALVLILPLYEGMPSLDVKRERKLKEKKIVDGKEVTVDTGETEEYLSARKYADSATVTLPGFEITPGFKVRTGIRFFEAPPKSATAGNDDDDSSGSEDESGAE